VDILQLWIVVGIPTLVLGLALFMGHSRTQAVLGYLVLGGGFVAMAAFHRSSGALFGGVLALLYAAGRGGSAEGADHRPDDIGIPAETEDPGHGHIGASGTSGTADLG
jgi:hypothetical protein